jgi:hypothetical protein
MGPAVRQCCAGSDGVALVRDCGVAGLECWAGYLGGAKPNLMNLPFFRAHDNFSSPVVAIIRFQYGRHTGCESILENHLPCTIRTDLPTRAEHLVGQHVESTLS